MANTPVTALRLNPQLKSALKAEADRQHRSLSNLMELILWEWATERKLVKPPTAKEDAA